MAYTFANGSGTEADPYLVATADDLNGVRDHLDAHFKQTADIDLSGYENWEPIGTDSTPFKGVYDGNNHVVNRMTITISTYRHFIGLFGKTQGSIIKNLGLVNINISGNGSYVGGLVGDSWSSSFYNCYCMGTISGQRHIGGLIGTFNNGAYQKVFNCYTICSITTADYSSGGLMASCISSSAMNHAFISRCYSSGDITSRLQMYVGGLIGQIQNTTITSSYYDSETSGQTDTGKGEPKTTAETKQQATFVDWDFDTVWAMDSSINDGYPCLQWQIPPLIEVWTAEDLNNVRNNLSGRYIQMADIDLSGYENWEPIGEATTGTGHFSGHYDGNGFAVSNLTMSYSDFRAVGLFGSLFNGSIKNLGVENVNINCSGAVFCAGGLVGTASSDNKSLYNITNCYSEGTVISTKCVGLLVGSNGAPVIKCWSEGSVRAETYQYADAGGLVGHQSGHSIENSCSYANVEGVRAGGLLGTSYPGAEVINSYSGGTVRGSEMSGGLVGHSYSIRVTNCYSKCFVELTPANPSRIGGLLGYGNSTTICSYYDSTVSGQSDTGKGEPKTTAEMKTQSTYTDWDFADVWGIDPAKNDGYPYLQWQKFEEPFQPWTPPKLEPSWWEGFKLPFNVLELDEDAPLAIQRNFKEIEHYINFLGKASGEIKDNLELLAATPAPMSEEEMPDPEPEAPPTDSYFAGYILGKEGQMGSIDAAIKTDSLGGINEVWIARVIDKQGIVEIYDSDAPEHIFRTVAREFNLPLVNLGADVVDVAIEFDGTYDQYNIFVSETEPHIFWVERTGSEDIIYTIKWGGVDPAPEPIELARAQLGYLGSGITIGLDPNITV